MLEALWTTEFISNQNLMGRGIAIFETGRVYGGDASFYYLGTCEAKHGAINGEAAMVVEGKVRIIHYAGTPLSVIGFRDDFELEIRGKLETPHMRLIGQVVDDPSKYIIIKCTKRQNLL